MYNRICKICGKSFITSYQKQVNCGSFKDKNSCSYKNYLNRNRARYSKGKEYYRNYYKLNKDKIRINYDKNRCKYNKKRREERKYNRSKVLNHYGGNPPKCNICGFDNINCLEVDHINNDGYKSGKTNRSGTGLYKYIIKNNYPKDYQILCKNCNWLKYINNKKAN